MSSADAALKARRPTFDREKFKRLIHYILCKAGHDPGVAVATLGRLLWHADTRAYLLTGASITGATYIRRECGPVPSNLAPVIFELEREGRITSSGAGGEFERTRLHSLTPPDPSFFSEQEIRVVERSVEDVEGNTPHAIDEQGYDYPWEIVRIGGELPPYGFLASRVRKPREAELDWAKRVAENLKLP